MSNKRQEGAGYERFAADYLTAEGYEIREQNYRTRTGEIDLIAREGEYLCFVEVKYRSSDSYGTGAEAVDRRKQAVIARTARVWLLEHGLDEWTACRFDVLYIDGCRGNEYAFELIRNAFELRSLR